MSMNTVLLTIHVTIKSCPGAAVGSFLCAKRPTISSAVDFWVSKWLP